jgi:ABC-type glutathione transport system ATPase component
MRQPVLELRNVTRIFNHGSRLRRLLGAPVEAPALDDVSLRIEACEVVGVVGESGSGKSTLAQIAVGLLKPTSGEVLLNGVAMSELLAQRDKSWRRRVQMVFQDTGSALNPRKTVARCLTETLKLRGVPKADRHREAVETLRLVGLEESIMARLPHELSGGQRQRVGIARALAMKPEILIADEPVSALDVSLQAQVVNLLIRLTAELGLTLVFISHDLALVRSLCSRVVVMRAGKIVEEGPALKVLDHPEHPYTQLLRAAVPKGYAGRSASAGNETRQILLDTAPR